VTLGPDTVSDPCELLDSAPQDEQTEHPREPFHASGTPCAAALRHPEHPPPLRVILAESVPHTPARVTSRRPCRPSGPTEASGTWPEVARTPPTPAHALFLLRRARRYPGLGRIQTARSTLWGQKARFN